MKLKYSVLAWIMLASSYSHAALQVRVEQAIQGKSSLKYDSTTELKGSYTPTTVNIGINGGVRGAYIDFGYANYDGDHDLSINQATMTNQKYSKQDYTITGGSSSSIGENAAIFLFLGYKKGSVETELNFKQKLQDNIDEIGAFYGVGLSYRPTAATNISAIASYATINATWDRNYSSTLESESSKGHGFSVLYTFSPYANFKAGLSYRYQIYEFDFAQTTGDMSDESQSLGLFMSYSFLTE